MLSLIIDSKVWFYRYLAPELKKLPGIQARYQMFAISNGEYVHEYFVKGKKHDWIGFDPVMIREADNDDPKRVAKFLHDVVTNKLHPAIYQYLLGGITQRLIMSGEMRGWGPMFRKDDKAGKLPGAQDKLNTAFEQELALDNDVKRVAAKRDHDLDFERKVLGERPHLLKPEFQREIEN